MPRLPIYVDSPLATKLTKVFGEHPEVYDRGTHETFLQNGRNPFSSDQIHFTQTVDESIADLDAILAICDPLGIPVV